jgi:hypothetical protein
VSRHGGIGLVLAGAVAPGRTENPASAAPLTAAQVHGLKAKNRFRECADCPEMIVVPAGSWDRPTQRLVTPVGLRPPCVTSPAHGSM